MCVPVLIIMLLCTLMVILSNSLLFCIREFTPLVRWVVIGQLLKVGVSVITPLRVVVPICVVDTSVTIVSVVVGTICVVDTTVCVVRIASLTRRWILRVNVLCLI